MCLHGLDVKSDICRQYNSVLDAENLLMHVKLAKEGKEGKEEHEHLLVDIRQVSTWSSHNPLLRREVRLA